MHFFRAAFVTLLLSAPAFAVCPVGWICPADAVFTSKVGAWYSVYWQGPGSTGEPNDAGCGTFDFHNHWSEFPVGWNRYSPVLGLYDSGDPAVLAQHSVWMRSMGVDFLLLDDTNHIHNDCGLIDENVTQIFDWSDAQEASHLNLAVALGAELYEDDNVGMMQASADFVYSKYVLNTGGTPRPSYYWTSSGSQSGPLLVDYDAYWDYRASIGPGRANWVDANDSRTRFLVRYATGLVDRANPRLTSTFSAISSWWGWISLEPQYFSTEAMTVTPGYDIRHKNTSVDARIPSIARENGLYFARQWLNAIRQNPGTIMVSSWNDFAEENAIEPATVLVSGAEKWVDAFGDESPNFYLEMATAYSQLRTGLMAGAYYRDEDDVRVFKIDGGARVYQSAMPHPSPVVPLPAGMLSRMEHPKNGFSAIKGTAPDVYVVQDGKRWYISTMQDLANLGYPNVVSVSDASLASIPLGGTFPSLPGRVVQRASNGALYFMDRGIKRPLTEVDRQTFGFPSPLVVSDAVLNQLPTGGWLEWPVKTSTSGTVYLASNGRRKSVPSMQALIAHGYASSEIVTISDAQMANYQYVASVLNTPTGLVRRSDGRFYVLDRGTKRPTTLAEASYFGFPTSPYFDVLDGSLDLMQTGVTIQR